MKKQVWAKTDDRPALHRCFPRLEKLNKPTTKLSCNSWWRYYTKILHSSMIKCAQPVR